MKCTYIVNVKISNTPSHTEIVNLCVILYIYEWFDNCPIVGNSINPTNSYYDRF